MISTNIIITTLISVTIGGVINGIFVFCFQKNITRIMSKKEKAEEHKKELRKRRREIDEEMWHGVGRVFFWVNKAILTGTHNGELAGAMQSFIDAEAKRKTLDRDIISDCEE